MGDGLLSPPAPMSDSTKPFASIAAGTFVTLAMVAIGCQTRKSTPPEQPATARATVAAALPKRARPA